MGCGTSAARNSVPPTSSSPHQHRSHNPVPPLVSRPLTRPMPYRHGTSITTGELNNIRSEFWSTRVEGELEFTRATLSKPPVLSFNTSTCLSYSSMLSTQRNPLCKVISTFIPIDPPTNDIASTVPHIVSPLLYPTINRQPDNLAEPSLCLRSIAG